MKLSFGQVTIAATSRLKVDANGRQWLLSSLEKVMQYLGRVATLTTLVNSQDFKCIYIYIYLYVYSLSYIKPG